MLRTFQILLLASALPAAAAESPAEAVAAFLKSLEEGKTTVAENETLALSPFAPEEKKAKFEEGLAELAEEIKGTAPVFEPVAEPKGNFAGFRLILRQKQNPLEVAVRAICVVKADGKWKVAAGLSHFDNTNFGFDENLVGMASEVAESTRRDAQETGRRLLAQGAESLWKDIRARREQWPKNNSPEEHLQRFLELELAGDAIGKMACFHLTPDLPAASLERLLSLLSNAKPGAEDDEPSPDVPPSIARDNPFLSIPLGGHEDDGSVCRVFGFMSEQDPSDQFLRAFYLRRGEGGRWLLIPDGYEVEGLRSPDSDLVNWFEENEMILSKQFIVKIAEMGRKKNPPSQKRADGAAILERYLSTMAARRIPEAFAVLDFPEENIVDDYDGLVEELAKECLRLAPPDAGAPVILPLRWQEVGDFGGAVHAIFQPEATRPFLLHTQLARWTPGGWKVLTPPWEDGPESLIHQPDARKLQTELEVGWEEMKIAAVDRIFGATVGQSANAADPEKAVQELVSTAFAAAISNQQKEYLAAWKPIKDGAINPVSALEMAARLGKELRVTGKVPETELLHRGELVGILMPVNQARREDGQKPARLIIARREADLWTLVPGLEFFRPINRGFKELNQKSLAAANTAFDEAGRSSLKDLLSWLEQSPPDNKPE